MSISEISLKVKDADQLLVGPDSLFYGKRILSPEAEEFIIEEVKMAPVNDHIHLKIRLVKDETGRSDEITTAIHDHFTYRRKKSEWQLRRVLQLGWRSLLISILLLGLLVWLTLNIILPEGGLSTTFRELLIILGWVALWRPADLLLYEWRPFKREVDLFHKIEHCKVEITKGKI